MSRAHVASFNQHYLFRGVVLLGQRRLSDILNDRLSPTFKMLDVRVYRLDNLSTPVYSTDEFFLRKQQFNIHAILKEERAAATHRLYAYVPKEQRFATLFLGGFQIEGTLHMRTKQDMTGTLVREGDMFIPMTEASVVHVHNPRLRIPSTTLLLRESALDALSVSDEAFSSRVV